MDELIQSVYTQLLADINPTREGESDALLIKVQNAANQIKNIRRYPSTLTNEFIASDMAQYFAQIYDLAMLDFNQRGAEGQGVIQENGEYRSFRQRTEMLRGVHPFAILV